MTKLPKKQIFDLAGENQLNLDGSYRQKILQACMPGARVEMVREPENKHGKNAIYVVLLETRQGIGYIAREDCIDLAAVIDSGATIKGRIHQLTGGLEGYENFGCRICIVANEKSFRDVLPLKPEQVYYEHSPQWRRPKANAYSEQPPSQKSNKGLLNTILARLFKK